MCPQTILMPIFCIPLFILLFLHENSILFSYMLVSHDSLILYFFFALFIMPKSISISTVFNLKYQFFVSAHFKILESWLCYLAFLFPISISCHLSVHIKKLQHTHARQFPTILSYWLLLTSKDPRWKYYRLLSGFWQNYSLKIISWLYLKI